jgi:hypothetical protein
MKTPESIRIANRAATARYRKTPKGKAILIRLNRELRRKKKTKLVALFGGRCVDCGYGAHEAALQFDHIDPAQKKFTISGGAGIAKSWDVLVAEARKCELVCANCHAIRTFMQHEDRIKSIAS